MTNNVFHHSRQMQEMRTHQKSKPPQATITTFSSIWALRLHCDGYTTTDNKSEAKQTVKTRHDGSVFQRSMSFPRVQVTIDALEEHFSQTLTFFDQDFQISFGQQRTEICKQSFHAFLRILRPQTSEDSDIPPQTNEQAKQCIQTIVTHL